MFPSLFPFGIGVFEMVNRPIKISLQLHTKHFMNLDETQYKFSKHHLFPIIVFDIIQRREICLGAKLTMCKSSNINEKELLNKLQSTYFDEIINNPQDINEKTNVQSLPSHIKIFNKYVTVFRISCASQRNQMYDKFYGNTKFVFHLKNFICPSSVNCYLN
jgi:hypothetical protein